MASADFSEDSEEKRPTVQVGDPFTEKLLIEACLELMASDAIVAIQDMGAAGLTSSSVEMASKGGVGIELDMNAVPCRETGMTPYEMMLSESQERMLMVLKPGREDFAEAIFKKWELDFAVIGHVTDTGRMVLKFDGATVADIPLGPLADEAPAYDRPFTRTAPPADLANEPETDDLAADLLKLIASPDIASRRWIWEQYDHMVGADTVQRPGGDAAVVRVHGGPKGLAITTDCTPRYCFADPFEGGKQAIAEAYRNICAVGAKPLATTDCMNFGNPQRPEIMGQFVGCIEGMAEACSALDFPIVSGNVSLYNETKNDDGTGSAILPTPAIGGVGLLADYTKSATIAFKHTGDAIIAVGERGGHLGQSIWLREVHGREDGPPPPVDLRAERRTGEFIRSAIERGLISACHDVSDGGMAVALAEMALTSGIGAIIDQAQPFGLAGSFFGEDQGLYLVTVPDEALAEFLTDASAADVPADPLGRTIKDRLIFELDEGDWAIPLDGLRAAHEGFFPALMGDTIA
jgi:phosphoribosylformylglycinamidine synthase